MKFGVIGNTNKPIVKEVAGNVIEYFQAKRITYVIHDELGRWINGTGNRSLVDNTVMCKGSEIARNCDILIALGGDGTMLMAARMVGEQGTPILGVNLGKLGFLAEVSADEIQECLEDILSRSYVL